MMKIGNGGGPMQNPCDICIVQAACKIPCEDFCKYVINGVPPFYYGGFYIIACDVRIGTHKFIYLGDHIIGVERK